MTQIALSDEIVLVAAENIASAELDGESVLLDVRAGQYYGLNELGSMIMNHLNEPSSVGQLKASILSDYKVETNQLENDLNAFLEEMIKYNLVLVKGN